MVSFTTTEQAGPSRGSIVRTAEGATPAERQRLIEKLKSIGELGPEDEAALNRLPLQTAWFEDGEDVVRDGDRPTQCCLVLTGLLCRYKLLRAGKRQIMAFHTPGDIPDS